MTQTHESKYQEYREATEAVLAKYPQHGVTWDDVEGNWGFFFPEGTSKEDADAVAREIAGVHNSFYPDQSKESGPFGVGIQGDGFLERLTLALAVVNSRTDTTRVSAKYEDYGGVGFVYPGSPENEDEGGWVTALEEIGDALEQHNIPGFRFWEICGYDRSPEETYLGDGLMEGHAHVPFHAVPSSE